MLLALHYLSKWQHSKIVKGIMWGSAPATVALIIAALAIFSELSMFTGPIPWRAILPSIWTGGAETAATLPGIRPLAVLICGACVYAILRTRIQVTTLILLSAAIGAVVFPLIGM